MARSELSEHLDAYGRPFGLIRLSSRDVHHYTVVFETYPDGGSLIDPEQLDSCVAHWANWLTQLGHDEGIRGAQVTIESSPDSGFRVRNLLEAVVVSHLPGTGRDLTNAGNGGGRRFFFPPFFLVE